MPLNTDPPPEGDPSLSSKMAFLNRMKRELKMLRDDPPPSIAVFCTGDSLDSLEGQILGTAGSPFEGGLFRLQIQLTERYPFVAPSVRFITPVYHPNIDDSGRICLDLLKGGWKPSLNLATLLTSIAVLMNEPNCDDALMAEISRQFVFDRKEYNRIAREWTRRHAMPT